MIDRSRNSSSSVFASWDKIGLRDFILADQDSSGWIRTGSDWWFSVWWLDWWLDRTDDFSLMIFSRSGWIRTGSDWWFSKIMRIRTGSDSISSDQDWTRAEKFHNPLISGPNLPQSRRHTKKVLNPKVPGFLKYRPRWRFAFLEGLNSSQALPVGKLWLDKVKGNIVALRSLQGRLLIFR